MTRWKIHPGADNESTIGFQIYTTEKPNDPKTMMLQIADTGTIGLGTPPTDGVRLTVDGAVTATTISGDGGALTVGGQGLTQTLAGLRTDVEARAHLTGATFRGTVTAPSFSGDGGGLTVGGQGLTQTLASLRTDVEARAPLAGATMTGPLTVNAALTVGVGQLTTLGGDLTVKGNIGIGLVDGTPSGQLEIAVPDNPTIPPLVVKQGSQDFLRVESAGALRVTRGMHLLSGNQSTKDVDRKYDQITFGYNFTTDYRHAIKTRHDSTQQPMNAIDFYVWQPTEKKEAIGTLHTMSLNGGNVGIGTLDPTVKLQVIGPVMQQLDVIPCNGNGDWTKSDGPICQYFQSKLTGKPAGTYMQALADVPSSRGYYFRGWVAYDGTIWVDGNYRGAQTVP